MTTNEFQVWLKQERIRRGWSQEDLAREIGTTRITIHRWESGATTPTMFFWARLSKLLGRPIAELFPEASAEIVLYDSVGSITLPEETHSAFHPLMDDGNQRLKREHMQSESRQSAELSFVSEQGQLQLERQRLELMEKRMELREKQFLYARNKVETVLDVLEPPVDPEVRTMVLEAVFSYLESLPFDDEVSSTPFPSFDWIKETLEAAKREYTRIHFQRKAVNITAGQLEEILGHLDDMSVLGESDLAHMCCVSAHFKQGVIGTLEKGKAVREVLREALERLRRNGMDSDGTPEQRFYDILSHRYFKYHLKNEQIAARLGLSPRQYFRERRKAVGALLDALLEIEAAAVRASEEREDQ